MITPDEEVELSRRIKQGDEIALNKMVKANLRFVVSVAKQYQNQGLSLSDLINEGNLGLIKAAHRFDETRGFKFISYAVWWVRQSILSALAEQARVVRLPLNKVTSVSKVYKVSNVLEQELQRRPTVKEIANALEISVKEVREALANPTKHISMDAPLSQDDDTGNMYDLIYSGETSNPDNALIKESLKLDIDQVLATINPKEVEILKRYYGMNGYHQHSLEEIGQKLDLTRERVRQIKEKALRRLKQPHKNHRLKIHLG